MKKVYIPNKGYHQFKNAERFGKLVYLTTERINPFQVSNLFHRCETAMADSSADDYLMISSLPIINAVAASVLATKHGRLNLLLFNSRTEDYETRTIMLDKFIDIYMGGPGHGPE